MNIQLTVATVAVFLLFVGTSVAGELAEPVPIEAGGRPIDMEHGGHAAPFIVDFDGDGNKDLLTGERFDGRLRIYRNLGSNAEPKFDRYEWFKAGASLGRIPSG